jgi:hypothetical protein
VIIENENEATNCPANSSDTKLKRKRINLESKLDTAKRLEFDEREEMMYTTHLSLN